MARRETLVPLYDRVVVQRLEAEPMSPGGMLHVPENAQRQPWKGFVLAVGKGRLLGDGTLRPLELRVGDKVWLPQHGGVPVQVGGETLVVLQEHEVLMKIEEAEAEEGEDEQLLLGSFTGDTRGVDG